MIVRREDQLGAVGQVNTSNRTLCVVTLALQLNSLAYPAYAGIEATQHRASAQTGASAHYRARPQRAVIRGEPRHGGTAVSGGAQLQGSAVGRVTEQGAESWRWGLPSVPLASIPAPDNALGDLNGDHVADLLDLLRLRDIAVGAGPAPTPLESSKGDMNGDATLDSTDVVYLRSVLLGERGLPFIIDNAGGEVTGNGGRTTFTIPPGAFAEPKRVCVEDYPLASLDQDLASASAGWGGSSAFLAGARLVLLNPSSADSVLPAGVGLRERVLAGLPDTTQNSSVYNVGADLNGDGVPDLRRLGDLAVEVDSTSNGPAPSQQGGSGPARSLDAPRVSQVGCVAVNGRMYCTDMVFRPQPTIGLSAVSRVMLSDPQQTWVNGPAGTLESGMYMLLEGAGWESLFESDYSITFASATGETIRTEPLSIFPSSARSYQEVRGLICMVPLVATTTDMSVSVDTRLTSGYRTNALSLMVYRPVGAPLSAPRDSVLQYLAYFDSLLTRTARDSTVQSRAGSAGIDLYGAVAELRDSIASVANMPTELFDGAGKDIVRYCRNMQIDLLYREPGGVEGGLRALAGDCLQQCEARYATKIRYALLCQKILGNKFVATGAGIVCLVCVFTGNVVCGAACAAAGAAFSWCVISEYLYRYAYWSCRMECCLKDLVKSALGSTPRNYEFKFVCLHLDCQRVSGSMGGGAGGGGGGPSAIEGRAVGDRAQLASVLPGRTSGDLSGVVVSVKDSPIPVSQAVTDRTGKFFIPFNVLSGDVVLTAYDPQTGFFVDSLASVAIGDPLHESHAVFGLTFGPDTTTESHPLSLGQWVHGEVATAVPNVVYLLPVTSGQVGTRVNIGWRAAGALTLRIESPSGSMLYTNGGSDACANVREMLAAEAGVYKIRVGRGGAGEYGGFVVGASVSPAPPTPWLCGSVRGHLPAGYFDYVVADGGRIAASDTLAVGAGVKIEFVSGGSITADGWLRGGGTAAAPIRVRGVVGASSVAGREGRARANVVQKGRR